MNKEKEIIVALMKVIKTSKEQGIKIKEVSLYDFWFEDFEIVPKDYKLLGIKIS